MVLGEVEDTILEVGDMPVVGCNSGGLWYDHSPYHEYVAHLDWEEDRSWEHSLDILSWLDDRNPAADQAPHRMTAFSFVPVDSLLRLEVADCWMFWNDRLGTVIWDRWGQAVDWVLLRDGPLALSGQELALAVLSFGPGVEPDQQLELATVFALAVHYCTLGPGVL